MGETVYNDILKKCEQEIQETWEKLPMNWQESEIALLNEFIEDKTYALVGQIMVILNFKKSVFSQGYFSFDHLE